MLFSLLSNKYCEFVWVSSVRRLNFFEEIWRDTFSTCDRSCGGIDGTIMFSDGSNDIIDETIQFFKANVFFKSYEIKVIIFVTVTLLVELIGVGKHWSHPRLGLSCLQNTLQLCRYILCMEPINPPRTHTFCGLQICCSFILYFLYYKNSK